MRLTNISTSSEVVTMDSRPGTGMPLSGSICTDFRPDAKSAATSGAMSVSSGRRGTWRA